MQVRGVHPDRTIVELNPEERAEIIKGINRLGEGFTAMPPAVRHLVEALKNAEQSFADFGKQTGQRLDPAFSGPAEESFPIRVAATQSDWENSRGA